MTRQQFLEVLLQFLVFMMGAGIGSFLNVVIYRLPLGISVNNPRRSFCPACKKQIPWYRNIPLLSWLQLRGKCAECARAGGEAAEACVRDGDRDIGFAGHGLCHGVTGRSLDSLREREPYRFDTSVDHARGRRGAEAADRRKLQ